MDAPDDKGWHGKGIFIPESRVIFMLTSSLNLPVA